MSLYDLDTDIGEAKDLKANNPDIVAQLEQLADKARLELGDSARKMTGNGYREPGRVE